MVPGQAVNAAGAGAALASARGQRVIARQRPMRHRVRAALPAGLAILLLLGGCRTLEVAPPVAAPSLAGLDWPARRTALQARERFGLRGRVAVVAGAQGFDAALRWVQQGTLCTLDLNGPLGVGGVHVTSDGTRFAVTDAAGKRLDDEAARAALQDQIGIEPPLGHLRYWVQGVPDPALPAQENPGDQQRLAGLAQDGWDITYTAYQDQAGGLPRRLSLVRGDVRIRMVIDSWQ